MGGGVVEMSHKLNNLNVNPDVALKRIQARIDGRKAAAELFQLTTPPDGYGSEYADELCETLRKLLPQRKATEVKPEPLQPIARLGATIIEYGEYRDDSYDNIPLDRLDWYLRKAEENAKSLRAYLKHPEIESRRRAT